MFLFRQPPPQFSDIELNASTANQYDVNDHYYTTYQSQDNLNVNHSYENGHTSTQSKLTSSTPNNKNETRQRTNFNSVSDAEDDDECCTSTSSVDPVDSVDTEETSSSMNRVCAMHKLRKKIAILKAQIMKNLELNCDKMILDEKISKLQELQRKYVNLEKLIQSAGVIVPDDHDCCLTDREIGFDMTSSDESQLCQLGLAYCVEPSYNNNSSMSHENEYFISIPGYVVRGAGKQTHYEYEIRITLPSDKWTLLRRYRRFRELYLSMKNVYGSSVGFFVRFFP